MANFKAVLSNRCMIHGAALVSTVSYAADGSVAKSFLTCPLCNADQVDRMAKQPGTITVNVTMPARRQFEQVRKAVKEAIDRGVGVYIPRTPPTAPGEAE